MAGPLPPTPDFDKMVSSYQDICIELAKGKNIPVIAQGDAILAALNQMNAKFDTQNARMDALERNMNRRFDQINQRINETNGRLDQMQEAFTNKFDRLGQRQAASDHNQFARLQNSMLESSDSALYAIHDNENNPIQGFPTTPKMISTMNNQNLSLLLGALNGPTTGNITDKRQRLKMMVGLAPLGLSS